MLNLLEQTLNRFIGESSAAKDIARGLEGRSLQINVLGLGLRLRLLARDGRILVHQGDEGSATASVSGAPLSMLALLSGDSAGDLKASGAELEGDVETARQFARLLRFARPDLEELVAQVVGDFPAHEAARLTDALLAWGRRALHVTQMNVAEYLQEESRQLPAPSEVQAWMNDVEQLRDDVERLAHRAARLEESLRRG